jgi:hypothetical protein
MIIVPHETDKLFQAVRGAYKDKIYSRKYSKTLENQLFAQQGFVVNEELVENHRKSVVAVYEAEEEFRIALQAWEEHKETSKKSEREILDTLNYSI